jgi:hypothetical protein
VAIASKEHFLGCTAPSSPGNPAPNNTGSSEKRGAPTGLFHDRPSQKTKDKVVIEFTMTFKCPTLAKTNGAPSTPVISFKAKTDDGTALIPIDLSPISEKS